MSGGAGVGGRGPGQKAGIVAGLLLDALSRLVPVAAVVARGVRALAFAGLAAAAAIALVVGLRWLPEGTEQRTALALLLVLLAVPPAVLLAFYAVLRQVIELPERLRRHPDLARERAAELEEIAREARSQERPGWRRLPGSVWRLGRLVRSSGDLVAPHAPVLVLLKPAFLVAAVGAALVTPLLVLGALVVFLVAVATS